MVLLNAVESHYVASPQCNLFTNVFFSLVCFTKNIRYNSCNVQNI